ncbi:MAG TPA: sulfatase [Armatimonadota bacterium]|nr:sulfatase [Armatimonadota bacterium]
MNVIVIVADSFRTDCLGCYGGEGIDTPRLDELGAESILFTQAYADGLPTIPARHSMLTGRYTFPFRGWQPLEHDDVTLPEALWDKGYDTALITDVYHMLKPGMNFARGFAYTRFIRGQEYDPYIVDPSIEVDVDSFYKADGLNDEIFKPRFAQYLKNVSRRQAEEDYFAAQVMQAGMDWLETRHADQPFLLWLDCFDPHEPWDPPPPFDTMYDPDYTGKKILDPVPGNVQGYLSPEELAHVRALYAGEVTFVDKWVGLLLDRARSLGLLEKSLVVFTSDHGVPFGEHGIIRRCRPWLHQELVNVPLMLRYPDGTGAGQICEAFAQSCDLMPTILGFLGIEGPAGMTGADLGPLVRGEAQSVRDYAYSGFHMRAWSIRSQEHSYLLSLEGEPSELYNRAEDPDEFTNIYEGSPDVAEELEGELRRFVESLVPEPDAEPGAPE